MKRPRKTPPVELLLGDIRWSFRVFRLNQEAVSRLADAELSAPADAATANSLILELRSIVPDSASTSEGETIFAVESRWLQTLDELEQTLAARLEGSIRASEAVRYVSGD